MTDKTRRQKAVEIVKDVLKGLKDKRLKADDKGVYVNICEIPEKAIGQSLQKWMKKLISPSKPCAVCGLGAMFIAAVGRYNEALVQGGADYMRGQYKKDDTLEALLPFFDRATINRIEYTFECGKYGDGDNADLEFGAQFANPADRLKAICKNIIKHNGDFVTEDLA